MTQKEMIEAMLAGKTLVRDDGNYKCWFDPDHEDGPFIFQNGNNETECMLNAWNLTDWKIQEEPKKRPMTRDEVLGFVTNTLGIVVMCKDDADSVGPWSFNYLSAIDRYRWAYITKDGKIGEWHRFEVEE